MITHRSERIGSLIKEELSRMILKELEFSGALVTITDVKVSEDKKNAIVYFSVIPSEKSERVLKVLNKFRGRLQFILQRKIEIKPMPWISFRIDRVPEQDAKIEKVLLESGD